MMRFQFVQNHPFILESNDGRAREVTGQIELSDDDEAFVFGEQVIQEMTGQRPAICGLCHGALRGRAHRIGRTPLKNYQKPLSPWHLGVATQ